MQPKNKTKKQITQDLQKKKPKLPRESDPHNSIQQTQTTFPTKKTEDSISDPIVKTSLIQKIKQKKEGKKPPLGSGRHCC